MVGRRQSSHRGYALSAVEGADDQIYAIGGSSAAGSTSEVDTYNPLSNTWTTTPGLPLDRLGLGAAALPNGIILAISGFNVETNTYETEVDSLNVAFYSATASGSLTVTYPQPVVTADHYLLSGMEGQSTGLLSLAAFTDAGGGPVSDYSATINWGDAQTSSGQITQVGGTYYVQGSHTYTGVTPSNDTFGISINIGHENDPGSVPAVDLINLTPNATPSNELLTISPSPVVAGQPVTFTAVVTSNQVGFGTPTGTAYFDLGGPGGEIGQFPVALDDTGTATFTTTFSPPSVYTVQAEYGGDSTHDATQTPLIPFSVVPAQTSTTLTSSANPAFVSQPVTFTAVVAAQPQGLPVPTGFVQFLDNGTALDSSPIPLDGTGTAVFTTSSLAVGMHPIVAMYSGDVNDSGSSSSSLSQSVVSIPTPTVATVAAGSITATGATLNATVNPNGYSTTALFQYSTSPTFTPTVASTIGSGYTNPVGVAVDAAGDVFVADNSDNPLPVVYEVLPNGTIKTIGSGFGGPKNVAVDSAGDVFVSDQANNAVKEVLPDGTILTIGSGFITPSGVAVDAAGDVFVSDTANDAVKEVQPDGTILTIGSGFKGPDGVAVDAAGDVFVSDTGNNAVKEVLPNGIILTIGSGFGIPRGVAVDAAGDVFVSDQVNNALKEVLPNGTILTLPSGVNGPRGVAVDAAGDVFVADQDDQRIVELSTPAVTMTAAATPSPLTGTAATAVSATLTGLTPGTTYYDRVAATNAFGTVADSSVQSFSTTQETTTTTLTASADPTYQGQPLTLTATVAAVTIGAAVPTGTVTFIEDGSPIETVALDGTGTAVFTTSTLSPAPLTTIVAQYSGDPKMRPRPRRR